MVYSSENSNSFTNVEHWGVGLLGKAATLGPESPCLSLLDSIKLPGTEQSPQLITKMTGQVKETTGGWCAHSFSKGWDWLAARFRKCWALAAGVGNSMEVSQKTKNSSSMLGTYLKKNKNTNSKTHMQPNFHNSFIYNCLGMEAIEKIINRWMDKDVVHIYNGILLGHEKEQNFAICNNMDGFGGHYAKWNKSHRERQILGNFPGGPVVRALCFHCRGQGFNPWLHAVC